MWISSTLGTLVSKHVSPQRASRLCLSSSLLQGEMRQLTPLPHSEAEKSKA